MTTSTRPAEAEGCRGKHIPVRGTTELLGSGVDYETVPVMKCLICDEVLEMLYHPGEGGYDGEAD